MIFCCDELKIDMTSSFTSYRDLMDLLDDSNVVMILSTVIIILLTTILYVLARGKTERSSVLLVGISGAGKTQMFAQLVSGQTKETVTSLKENEAMYSTSADSSGKTKQLVMVDIPGSSSIRYQIFDNFKGKVRGLVFVVDSGNAQRNIKDVAVFLYQLLTDEIVNKFHPRILIACNKQDLLQAKSKRVIQGLLENELNTVRKTQSARLSHEEDDSSDAAASGATMFLGKKNESFQFQHLNKLDVKFCECSGKASEENGAVEIDEVKQWIDCL